MSNPGLLGTFHLSWVWMCFLPVSLFYSSSEAHTGMHHPPLLWFPWRGFPPKSAYIQSGVALLDAFLFQYLLVRF